jgi:hypothetical protein
MKKEILSEEINAMKYLLGYKRGVVISEQQVGNQKFNFNANPALTQGGINYTPTASADMLKNTQATVAGATTPATGAPAAQQKFNFNPNPNITPESGINLKMQTPQDLAKGVASATPAPAAPATPATNVSTPDLIKQIQTILKTRFNAMLGAGGPNKDGIDGVWGKNTQTAFENALKAIGSQAAAAPAAAPTTGTPAPAAGTPAPASGTQTPPVQFKAANIPTEIGFKPSTPKL